MELLFKTAIAVAVIVVIIAMLFLYWELSSRLNGALTSAQAASLIKSDILQHYPSAQVTILNVSNSSMHSGSWDILARIVYNQTTACPSVISEEFDYPATGLINQSTTYSNYANGVCIVNLNTGMALEQNIISLPAFAMASPLNHSFAPLVSFIQINGFRNVYASADHVDPGVADNITSSQGSNMTFNSTSALWLVNYTSHSTGRTLHLIMDTSGSILFNYTS